MQRCPTCSREFVDDVSNCPLDAAPLVRGLGELSDELGEIVGKYRLISILGEGGMGRIYIAKHNSLNRFVAIKRLHPRLQEREDNIARFFREAGAINEIKHPNIIQVYDLVNDSRFGAFCVLEMLNGPSLSAVIDRGALPLESAVHVGTQLADVLAVVHDIGIIHRDVKPDNVILIERGGRSDEVKLIDFGAAQMSGDETAEIPFGTPAYMSPEQGAGEAVDARSDIYSLGVVLYEMVTGVHPFPSMTDHEYLLRHADEEPLRPSLRVTEGTRIPRELDRIILRCLAKDPAERYSSATKLAASLRAVSGKPARRSVRKGFVAALLAAAAAAGAFFFVFGGGLPFVDDDDDGATAKPAVATLGDAPEPTAEPPEPTAEPPEPTAEPPEPTPAPVDATAVPAEVTIRFASTPAGAQVFRAGESVPLGVTPFELPLPRREGSTEIRFELDGYQDAVRDMSFAEDAAISEVLAKLPEPRRARRDRKRKRKHKGSLRDSESVMNPFD